MSDQNNNNDVILEKRNNLSMIFLMICFLSGIFIFVKNINHNHEMELKTLDFEKEAIERGYGCYTNGVFYWK